MLYKKACVLLLLLVLLLQISACGTLPQRDTEPSQPGGKDSPTAAPELGDDSTSFGEAPAECGFYDGYFDGARSNVTVLCLSGTADCYRWEGNTLIFSSVGADTVYSISGQLKGNVVIDPGDGYKFDLEMQGFSLISDSVSPIEILSGDEVTLTAKKGCNNYIYDDRDTVDEADEALHKGAIHAEVDLELAGKGALTVVSKNNNGIHTKDDLQVKNLTLSVLCADNALKGNDSVEITDANTTLIATKGDGIKTSNSNVSDKGNQRGTVTVIGGTHTIYAACDGIDAAYDIRLDGNTTSLSIYTDKYSAYSEEITAVAEDFCYIRFNYDSYRYSIKYYNSEEDYLWVNAEYHSKASGAFTSYYYYSYPKRTDYTKVQIFVYASTMEQGQDEEYLAATEYLSINTAYDTFALAARGNALSYEWTNYTTTVNEGMGGRPGGMGGPGGMEGGNPDKGNYSTKGIKAANEILILSGSLIVKSYDDAIHANGGSALENGENGTGNVTVSGGTVTVYSNDDGIHADGSLTISSGVVCVENSYEGLEGSTVAVMGGEISVLSTDDGINGTATAGTAVEIGGGTVYVYCGGDGIDSNSRSSYTGLIFSGGSTVVISTSSGNSAIDTEQGYTYSGGRVVAVMPYGGMANEATHCKDFSSVATNKAINIFAGKYLTVTVDGKVVSTVKFPNKNMSARVIYLGDNAATVAIDDTTCQELDTNGVAWN